MAALTSYYIRRPAEGVGCTREQACAAAGWSTKSIHRLPTPARIWYPAPFDGTKSRADVRRATRRSEYSMADAVAEKVIATLASVKRIPAENIQLDTNLQEMGIDSLDIFTLLFELENAFKITIPDDDVRSIKTVNDIVEGVKKLLAAAPPDASMGSASTAD
jgi:acyl carrier protein